MSSDVTPLLSLCREGIDQLRAYTVPREHPPTKLDANESPWPLPAEARARLGAAMAELPLHRYPDPRATDLRRALSKRTGGHPDDLVVGSGSDEIISTLMTALARPRDGAAKACVLAPAPSFVMYRIAAITHGLAPLEVPLDDAWDLDHDALSAALAERRPNLVFFATPNNPTGNRYSLDVMRRLIEATPDTLFVIDEAYAPFAGATLSALCDTHANVGVMSTLSKVGVAAARLGWIRLHPKLAAEVDKVRQPFNLNSFAQEAGRLALTELAPVLDEHVARILRERDRLGAALGAIDGVHVYPSAANFFFARLASNPTDVAERLGEQGIRIRSFHAHGARLAHHVRITVGTPDENARLLAALPGAL